MDIIFNQLVNSTSPSLNSSLAKNLTDLYEHYQLEYENSLTLYTVQKHLYNIIQDNLIGTNLYRSELFILKDQLLLNHFVKGEQLQPYLGILEIVIDAIRENDSNPNELMHQLVSFDAEDKWDIALRAAWDLAVINPKRIELKRELWRTRSLSTSSLDFYQEYEYARQLSATRDSMQENQ